MFVSLVELTPDISFPQIKEPSGLPKVREAIHTRNLFYSSHLILLEAFSANGNAAFIWKLHCYWLKGLLQLFVMIKKCLCDGQKLCCWVAMQLPEPLIWSNRMMIYMDLDDWYGPWWLLCGWMIGVELDCWYNMDDWYGHGWLVWTLIIGM